MKVRKQIKNTHNHVLKVGPISGIKPLGECPPSVAAEAVLATWQLPDQRGVQTGSLVTQEGALMHFEACPVCFFVEP